MKDVEAKVEYTGEKMKEEILGYEFRPYISKRVQDMPWRVWEDYFKPRPDFELVGIKHGDHFVPAEGKEDHINLREVFPGSVVLDLEQIGRELLDRGFWPRELHSHFYLNIYDYRSYVKVYEGFRNLRKRLLDVAELTDRKSLTTAFGVNVLFTQDSDTLAQVHWDPDRTDVLGDLVYLLERNCVDVLFHLNNIMVFNFATRKYTQICAQMDMDEVMLSKGYDWAWVVHSDILAPPFAREQLQSHGEDHVTAIVPRPYRSDGRAYHGYLTYRHKDANCQYNLKDIGPTDINPEGRVIADRGLMEISGTGWGCFMRSRKSVEEVSFDILDYDSPECLDTQWSRLVQERGWPIYMDCGVRCRHTHAPLNLGLKEAGRRDTGEEDWITEDWYGWNLAPNS